MAYIKGMGLISPVDSVGNTLLNLQIPSVSGGAYTCIEPDYKNYINPKLLRRMARLIKMSVAAATIALKDANIKLPDAIITATGLGCLQDTEVFLREIIRENESLLSPTAFIKSTHNTVGGQIALLLGLNAYNMTYSNRNFSFESALIDAQLLLQEGEGQNILVGGLDELTPTSTTFLQGLSCIANGENDILPAGGEGAGFLVLSHNDEGKNYAIIKQVSVAKATDDESIVQLIDNFVEQAGINTGKVDLILTGAQSEQIYITTYASVIQEKFTCAVGGYTHLSGTYFTSSAMACWLAALMINEQSIPSHILYSGSFNKPLHHILIYNRDSDNNHALILVSKC